MCKKGRSRGEKKPSSADRLPYSRKDIVLEASLRFCVVSSGKNRRLKQAKEEAQAEIEQYRLQREKEFKTKEAAVSLEAN